MAKIKIPVGDREIIYEVPDELYKAYVAGDADGLMNYLGARSKEIKNKALEMTSLEETNPNAFLRKKIQNTAAFEQETADERKKTLQARSPFPTTYNPLVQMGKAASDTKEGIRQTFGLSTKEEQDKYWKESELFDANQPWTTQIAPLGISLASSFAGPLVLKGMQMLGKGIASRGPAATQGVGRGLALHSGEGLKNIIRNNRLISVPGVSGAAGGGAIGATSMIDPELEGMDALKARGTNALFSGTVGAGLDMGMLTGKYIYDKHKASKLRATQSGDLPRTVRMPGPQLNENGLDMRQMNRILSTDPSGSRIPRSTTLAASTARGRADQDLQENVNIMMKDWSGTDEVRDHGEYIEDALDNFRAHHAADGDALNAQFDRLHELGDVSLGGGWMSNLQSKVISDLKDSRFEGRHIPVKYADDFITQTKKFQKSDPLNPDKITPGTPLGISDIRDLKKFLQVKKTQAAAKDGGELTEQFRAYEVIDDAYDKFLQDSIQAGRIRGYGSVGSGHANQAIANLQKQLRGQPQEVIDNATDVVKKRLSEKAGERAQAVLDGATDAMQAESAFNQKYYSNPILAGTLTKHKESGLPVMSGRDVSGKLFGPATSATKWKGDQNSLGAIKKLIRIDEKNRGPIMGELGQNLFKTTRKEPKFTLAKQGKYLNKMDNIDEFNKMADLRQYLMTPMQRKQWEDLTEVTSRLHSKPDSSANAPTIHPLVDLLTGGKLPGTTLLPPINPIFMPKTRAGFEDHAAMLRAQSGRAGKLATLPTGSKWGTQVIRSATQHDEERPDSAFEYLSNMGIDSGTFVANLLSGASRSIEELAAKGKN